MDIKFLKELNYIDYDPQRGLRIGAGTSQRAIERLEVIRERFRVLGEMESKLASIQTCNWGLLVAIFVMVVLLQTLLPFSLPWRPP